MSTKVSLCDLQLGGVVIPAGHTEVIDYVTPNGDRMHLCVLGRTGSAWCNSCPSTADRAVASDERGHASRTRHPYVA